MKSWPSNLERSPLERLIVRGFAALAHASGARKRELFGELMREAAALGEAAAIETLRQAVERKVITDWAQEHAPAAITRVIKGGKR
ncbi:MAG TPA: hypothetical protein VK510_03205 [Solirubrobacteraceae bacterium]|nr:hypothetical protein [Solirubrobacteraceae bacterium]